MMQEHVSLNELMERYVQGAMDKKELEEAIYRFLLNNPSRFWLDNNEEKRLDYLCWFYPRLSRIIDAYQNSGASFDAYLFASIRWSRREYFMKEVAHSRTEAVYWNSRAVESWVYNRDEEYLPVEPSTKPISNPRQVLILMLKSYTTISDDFISRIAPRLNMKKEEIQNLVDTLRRKRLAREDALRMLKERLQTQYYRCLKYEVQLRELPEDSINYNVIQLKLEHAKIQLTRLREKCARRKTLASNRQVAEVLGIPKGTVDSAMHAVKHRSFPY
ncbi:hypothetical protein FACS1894172_01280 [Spirochaetia bacterium]|nr:hypothetical protein FACS1894164_15280 [Spirochaetia bacterium]GHU29671.1 hypothetical protein FACS1894172_01280 [Spirochaetia bacterium]